LATLAKPNAGYFGAPRYYLLSTVAQSLAASFALAFTVALIGAQFASRYTIAGASSFFDIETVLHALLFVVAICYSTVLIALSPRSPLYDAAAVGLAAYCLLWLVRLFFGLKTRMSPANHLTKLIKDFVASARWYDVDMDSKIFAPVDEIESIMGAAYAAKDYSTFKLGYSALARASLGTMLVEAYEARQEMRYRLSGWAVALRDDAHAVATAATATAELCEGFAEGTVFGAGLAGIRELWKEASVTVADSMLISCILKGLGRLAQASARLLYPSQAEEAANEIHRTALEWSERTGSQYPDEAARQVFHVVLALTVPRHLEKQERPITSLPSIRRDPMKVADEKLVRAAIVLWTASATHIHSAGDNRVGNVASYLVWLLKSRPEAYEQSYVEAMRNMKSDVAGVAQTLHQAVARQAAEPEVEE
jgi:hypothetical protein